jgi:hypothetical protein
MAKLFIKGDTNEGLYHRGGAHKALPQLRNNKTEFSVISNIYNFNKFNLSRTNIMKSTALVNVNNSQNEILEKVILGNDLADLQPQERVQYIHAVCSSLGLNPMTNPIKIMKFQGKMVPYAAKEASEQLRKINKISISSLDSKVLPGDLYVVTATACTPDGRTDSSTGAISIAGLKGEAIANAMMKCETKAKRRVTLSICGLGFIDETEVESIPGAMKISVDSPSKKAEVQPLKISIDKTDFTAWLKDIEEAETLDELQAIFRESKKQYFMQDKEFFEKIIDAKDRRKYELQMENESPKIDVNEANLDPITGEVFEV